MPLADFLRRQPTTEQFTGLTCPCGRVSQRDFPTTAYDENDSAHISPASSHDSRTSPCRRDADRCDRQGLPVAYTHPPVAHTTDLRPGMPCFPSAIGDRNHADVRCASRRLAPIPTHHTLPPRARIASQAFPRGEVLHCLQRALAAAVGVVERVFQIAEAIVLCVFGLCQFRAILLAVRE